MPTFQDYLTSAQAFDFGKAIDDRKTRNLEREGVRLKDLAEGKQQAFDNLQTLQGARFDEKKLAQDESQFSRNLAAEIDYRNQSLAQQRQNAMMDYQARMMQMSQPRKITPAEKKVNAEIYNNVALNVLTAPLSEKGKAWEQNRANLKAYIELNEMEMPDFIDEPWSPEVEKDLRMVFDTTAPILNAGKTPTKDQEDSGKFAKNMIAEAKIMFEMLAGDFNGGGVLSPDTNEKDWERPIRNLALVPKQRPFDESFTRYGNALLRKESGASFAQSEEWRDVFSNYIRESDDGDSKTNKVDSLIGRIEQMAAIAPRDVQIEVAPQLDELRRMRNALAFKFKKVIPVASAEGAENVQ
jgi:hypothetical protein